MMKELAIHFSVIVSTILVPKIKLYTIPLGCIMTWQEQPSIDGKFLSKPNAYSPQVYLFFVEKRIFPKARKNHRGIAVEPLHLLPEV